jgi:hypothetical protein
MDLWLVVTWFQDLFLCKFVHPNLIVILIDMYLFLVWCLMDSHAPILNNGQHLVVLMRASLWNKLQRRLERHLWDRTQEVRVFNHRSSVARNCQRSNCRVDYSRIWPKKKGIPPWLLVASTTLYFASQMGMTKLVPGHCAISLLRYVLASLQWERPRTHKFQPFHRVSDNIFSKTWCLFTGEGR